MTTVMLGLVAIAVMLDDTYSADSGRPGRTQNPALTASTICLPVFYYSFHCSCSCRCWVDVLVCKVKVAT